MVTIAAAVLIAFVIRTFLFEPVRVDGGSMLETLQDGEIMFVTKYDYLTSGPERFDVVICHYPNRGSTNFVKRVVGLPGDTVEIRGGYLYVNGERYEEDYIEHRPYADFAAYTVPEGYYFVMGDNRANSHDSRADDVGPIARDQIVGPCAVRAVPLQRLENHRVIAKPVYAIGLRAIRPLPTSLPHLTV